MATPEDPTTRRVAATTQAFYRGTPDGGGWAHMPMPPNPVPPIKWKNRPATSAMWLDHAAGTGPPGTNLAVALCKDRLRPRDGDGKQGSVPGHRTVIVHDIDGQVDPVAVRDGMLEAWPHLHLSREQVPPVAARPWPVLTPAHVPWLVVAVSPGGYGVHVLAHAARPIAWERTRRLADRLETLAMAADQRVGGGWHHDKLLVDTCRLLRVIGAGRPAPTKGATIPPGPNAGAVLGGSGTLVRGDALAEVLETAIAAAPLAIGALSDCWVTAHASLYSHRWCPDPIPIAAGVQNRTAYTLAGSLIAGFGLDPTPEAAQWAADVILDVFVFADDQTATAPQWTQWQTQVHATAQSAATEMAAGIRPGGCWENPLCRRVTVGKPCSEPSGACGVGADAPDTRTHPRLVAVPAPRPPVTGQVVADVAADLDLDRDPPDEIGAATAVGAIDAAGALRRLPKKNQAADQLLTTQATPHTLTDAARYILVLNQRTGEQASISVAGTVLTAGDVACRVDVDRCDPRSRVPIYTFVPVSGGPGAETTLAALCGDKGAERRHWAVDLGIRSPVLWQACPDTALALLRAAINRTARPRWRPEHDQLADAAYAAVWRQAPGPEGADRRAVVGREGVMLRTVLDAYRKATGETQVRARVELFFREWPTDEAGTPRHGVRVCGGVVTVDPIDPTLMAGAGRRAGEEEAQLDADAANLEPPVAPPDDTPESTEF